MSKSGQAEKQQFFYMFDKWRMVTLIARLKHGGVEASDIIHTLLNLFKNRAASLVEEDLENQRAEVLSLKEDIDELKLQLEAAEYN